ncbi:hypothetical protein EKH55_1115 [Sinorhizobium alkalisoli]|nr:hypothetical protein EKH55_1115 [Sinorhizobium alkalisoli]
MKEAARLAPGGLFVFHPPVGGCDQLKRMIETSPSRAP